MKLRRFAIIVLLSLSILAVHSIIAAISAPHGNSAFAVQRPIALISDEQQVSDSINFLEARIQRDPDDALLYNKLGGYYLQELRESGALQYLDLMSRAAHASLASVRVIRNADGLSLLTLAEFSSHEFRAAKAHATQLTHLDPAKQYPYEMLFDADIEMGDYAGAESAFTQLLERTNGMSLNVETRKARLTTLHGDYVSTARHLSNAIALGFHMSSPPRESIAWCYWQLGETAFNAGDYPAAEEQDRNALITFPGYYRALASLGRVRAARGDLQDAIMDYKSAIDILPDPTYVAALGDLYKLAGEDKDASDQYALVEVIGHLSAISGVLYNRPLALYHADHDIMSRQAYTNAKSEFRLRQDIYGADALAWTALKAGEIQEARIAIAKAMRLGTLDSKLFYHAGMIALASGDDESARTYLRHALTLSPIFDPLQALRARNALRGATMRLRTRSMGSAASP